ASRERERQTAWQSQTCPIPFSSPSDRATPSFLQGPHARHFFREGNGWPNRRLQYLSAPDSRSAGEAAARSLKPVAVSAGPGARQANAPPTQKSCRAVPPPRYPALQPRYPPALLPPLPAELHS